MRLAAPLALAALLLGACSDQPTAAGAPASLRVAARHEPASGGYRIENTGTVTAFYAVLEQGTLALALLAPCVDEARCPSLAPGRQVLVPYADITGLDGPPGDRVVVIAYWQAVRGADGTRRPDGFATIAVQP